MGTVAGNSSEPGGIHCPFVQCRQMPRSQSLLPPLRRPRFRGKKKTGRGRSFHSTRRYCNSNCVSAAPVSSRSGITISVGVAHWLELHWLT